jgi:DtxR family Mn-dependent transcriptional regulator
MSWDEVHDIAEELEHIQSETLIDRLDAFLGFPKYDPHGDPIPNAKGKYTLRAQLMLTELQPGQEAIVIGVKDANDLFLKNLNEKGIAIGTKTKLLATDAYDQTMRLTIEDKELSLAGKVAQNILIKLI